MKRIPLIGRPAVAVPACLVVLTIIVLIQATAFRRSKSITFDETVYLSFARQSLWSGTLDRRLASYGVAPLPVVICHLPAAWGHGAVRDSPTDGQVDDRVLIDRARCIASVVFGVAGVWIVFCLLLRRAGLWAACLGGGLAAFSPNLVAHGSLATTDMAFAVTSLLAVTCIVAVWKEPSIRNLAVCGLALGTALSAKYTAVFLVPISLLAVTRHFATCRGTLPARVLDVALSGTLLAGVAALVLWAWHSFQVVPIPPKVQSLSWFEVSGWDVDEIELPAPLVGMLVQAAHNTTGHEAYLMGQLRAEGWWYYFPVAWFVKSTPAEWCAAIIVMAWAGIWFLRGSGGRGIPVGIELFVWALSLLILLALCTTSRINIGLRYLLPAYPILFLLAASIIAVQRPRLAVSIGAFLIIIQAASAVTLMPDYLAYFSPLVGGPSRGDEWLVDSNLDWGQDLPALRDVFERVGAKRPLVCYFGTAHLQAYRVTAERLTDDHTIDLSKFDWIAVSVTSLHGVYVKDGAFAHHPASGRRARMCRLLRGFPPDARAGHSIRVYRLDEKLLLHLAVDEQQSNARQ